VAAVVPAVVAFMEVAQAAADLVEVVTNGYTSHCRSIT